MHVTTEIWDGKRELVLASVPWVLLAQWPMLVL